MPLPYASSVEIGGMNSFINPDPRPEDADQMEEWARNNGYLGKTKTVKRKGSTIWKNADGSYTARPNTDIESQGLVNNFGAQGTTMAPNVIQRTEDREQEVTPHLSNQRMRQLRPQYQSFLDEQSGDIRRQKLINERLGYETQLMDKRAAIDDKRSARERGYYVEDRDYKRKSDLEDIRLRQGMPDFQANLAKTNAEIDEIHRLGREAQRAEEHGIAGRAAAGQYKPQSHKGQMAWDAEIQNSGDPMLAAKAARTADMSAEQEVTDLSMTSFLSDLGDFNKRDVNMFGLDPTQAESDSLIGRAKAIEAALVKRGLEPAAAHEKVRLLMSIGLADRSAMNSGMSQNLYRAF